MDEDIALEVISRYLGGMIDRIIEKNGFKLDIDDDYEELLLFIYDRLIKIWFKKYKPSEEEFEDRIKHLKRRRRAHLEVLLSYLISKYVQSKTTLTVHSGRDLF